MNTQHQGSTVVTLHAHNVYHCLRNNNGYYYVKQVLIHCSGPPDEAKNEATGQVRKREALMAQLDRRSGGMRTLIFCNTIQSCREVSERDTCRPVRRVTTTTTVEFLRAYSVGG
jgi:hypothetical protein